MGANASQKLNLSGFPKDLTIKLTAKAYDTEQSNCSFLKKIYKQEEICQTKLQHEYYGKK